MAEYSEMLARFQERRWTPAELSAGRFCEIVYTILHGYGRSTYPARASKPRNFVQACRQLEQHTHGSRSFQILIPRLLPALYEVRNNRGVGHVGGDVDPNHMDSEFVVASAGWIMAELVRVFHGLDTGAAQKVADRLAEPRTPLVWIGDATRRVLDPKMPLKDQILVLASTSSMPVGVEELFDWLGYDNRPYFLRVLRQMHRQRLIELSKDEATVELLPPGSALLGQIAASRAP